MIKLDTTTSFINDHLKPSGFTAGDTVSTEGYASKGDLGAAVWRALGTTGTASQDPLTNNSPNLSDASGNEFTLVADGVIDLNALGGTGVSYQNIADAAGFVYSQGLTSNPNVSDRYIDADVAGMTARANPQVDEAYIVSDRANGIFDTISGTGAANGFNIIAHATLNFSFVLRAEEVLLSQFGVIHETSPTVDNREAFQHALDYAKTNELGEVYADAGIIYVVGEISKPQGVTIVGKGKSHWAFYRDLSLYSGTLIISDLQAGEWCVTFDGFIRGHAGIRSLSWYEQSTNAIAGICNITGILNPILQDVEFASLGTARGEGLRLARESASELTIYGQFDNVVIKNCYDGLVILGDTISCKFNGGEISGKHKSLRMELDVKKPQNITFSGTTFESTYDDTVQEIEYLDTAASRSIRGVTTNTPVYACKFLSITDAKGIAFSGGYAENGGMPATYDDGVNGVLPIYAVVAIEPSTPLNAKHIEFSGFAWNCFLLDNGFGTIARGLPNEVDYNGANKSLFTVRSNNADTITDSTLTTVVFSGSQPALQDSVFDYDDTTGILTFNETGKYDVLARVSYDAFTPASARSYLRVNSNLNYAGRNVSKAATNSILSTEVNCTLDITSGDTMFVQAYQSSGSDRDLSAGQEDNYLQVRKL